MCHVVYAFRTSNEIKDIYFYTREKADVVIDNPESSIQFLFNLHHVDFKGNDRRSSICSQSLSLEHLIQNDLLSAPRNQPKQPEPTSGIVSCTNHKGIRGRYFRTKIYESPPDHPSCDEDDEDIEDVGPALFCVVPKYKCSLVVDAHLAACIAEATRRSQAFRRRSWRFLKKTFGFYSCLEEYQSWDLLQQEQCWTYLKVKHMVDIVCVWPKQRIDFAWGWRVGQLVEKRVLVEEALAWLSTLGGGYSSLGDYYREFAEKAGQISWHQLKLALEIGDPIVAAKCRVFWAQSLMQRGYLRQSKAIVWEQYQLARSHPVRDEKLMNMCLSVWNRLKFLYKQRRLKRSSCQAVARRIHTHSQPSPKAELATKDGSLPAVHSACLPLVGY